MQILITAPTKMELAPFFLQQIKGIDCLITGIGTPATIYNLQKKIQNSSYDLIIQAGIAGSFDLERFPPGKTVIVHKDIFGDLGIIEEHKLSSMADMGYVNADEEFMKDGWMVNENPFLNKLKLKLATGLTMNTITDNKEHEAIFTKKYEADIETMEGAAFHYVCIREKITFLQLRSISNAVGERDKAKWEMKKAILELNNSLATIIEELKK